MFLKEHNLLSESEDNNLESESEDDCIDRVFRKIRISEYLKKEKFGINWSSTYPLTIILIFTYLSIFFNSQHI